jgi:predicted SAM-dependent methyltransferase
MSILKSIKTAFRKKVLNPFGYDLVPLREDRRGLLKSTPKPRIKKRDDDYHIEQYIEIFGLEAAREKRFYNVGAEPGFRHPVWTAINHPSTHYGDDYMDMKWDLLSGERLPIEDGKAKVIFSRYTLEHVPDNAVNHFLQEAFRSLGRNGIIRLIVPDIDIFYLAYLAKMPDIFHRPNQDKEHFPNIKFLINPNTASFEQRFLWTFASNVSELHPDGATERITDDEFRHLFKTLKYEDALDHCTSMCSLEIQKRHPENHINWFNSKKLESMMLATGFNNVYQSGFGQSKSPVMRAVNLFEGRRPEIGLYMEAVK